MTTTQLLAESGETAVRITPRRARIDVAHPVVGQSDASRPSPRGESATDSHPPLEIEQPPPEVLAALAGLTPEARREQLETEAAQLGEYLRERLREVDRREAQLNARAAQLEADLRAGRTWAREREQEFQQREAQLRQQIDDLTSSAAAQADGDDGDALDLATARQHVLEREHQLQLKENDLRERRLATDRHLAALRHGQQVWEQERARQEAELARQQGRLAAEFCQQSAERNQQLAAAEERLAEQARQLAQGRDELAADRQAWDRRRQAQEEKYDQRAQAAESEHEDRRQRLEARARWVEEQKAGLEQVRGEILGLHRQALESRLVAEQLWSQINGRLPAAEVAHAAAQLRQKLAEHYKLEEQSLLERKRELEELGQRVSDQHRELVQLREGLKAWLTARQAEIESQAATLVQRELALDEQQEAQRAQRRQWESERREFERQISRLTAERGEFAES